MQAFVKYPHFSDTFVTLSLNLALLLSMFCLTHAKVIFVFLQWDKITMTVLKESYKGVCMYCMY